MNGMENLNTEVVNLFPGWAVRKYPTSARASIISQGPSDYGSAEHSQLMRLRAQTL